MDYNLYPLLFAPVYKDYIWGGSRIPQTFNRPLPEGIYAESWEISDHIDGMSIVSNGKLRGKSLRELLEKNPQQIMGSNVSGSQFPLLIKLIDARQKLSVQVHPDAETAAKFGGEPKTEMWYMLGENESYVYCGLKDRTTQESFKAAIENGTSGKTMRPVPVKKEDAVFVPAGCLHAIAEGCLLLEIQQKSNTTYRICDWGRVGVDGKPRELHIEQGLKAIDWNNTHDPHISSTILEETDILQCSEILKCEYFRMERLRISAPHEVALDGTTFHALFVSEGHAKLFWDDETIDLPAGTSVLIPAALSSYTLGGSATILRTTIPYKFAE